MNAAIAVADDAAMARFHYERGREHYAAGDYEEAIREFFAEQRLTPSARTLYNIGLCFLQLDRREQAFHFLNEFLGLTADDESETERRAYARNAIESMEGTLARVEIVSHPAGAEILVDHAEHGSWGLTPRTLALEPGEHRVWVRLDGFQPVEVTVEAVEGEQLRTELTMERILGRLRIEATGTAAVVVFDGAGERVAEGPAPLERELPPGSYEVEVREPRGRAWRRLVVVEAGETAERMARLDELPPPTGLLSITSDVPESIVRLDGEPAGFTPFVLPEAVARSYELSVEASGYQRWRGSVPVESSQRTLLAVDLAPEPEPRSPFTWVVGGAGVAALLAAAGVGVAAIVRENDLDARIGNPLHGDLVGDRERVRRLNVTADVLAVAALVSLGGSVLLYLFTGSRDERSTATTTVRERGGEE